MEGYSLTPIREVWLREPDSSLATAVFIFLWGAGSDVVSAVTPFCNDSRRLGIQETFCDYKGYAELKYRLEQSEKERIRHGDGATVSHGALSRIGTSAIS